MRSPKTVFVVNTHLGEVKEEYLTRVDSLIRDHRLLEIRLDKVRTQLASVLSPKGGSLTGLPKGNLPSDPTGNAAASKETLEQQERELANLVGDAEFLLGAIEPAELAILRRFHSPDGRRAATPKEKRARMEILAGWAYALYGAEIFEGKERPPWW